MENGKESVVVHGDDFGATPLEIETPADPVTVSAVPVEPDFCSRIPDASAFSCKDTELQETMAVNDAELTGKTETSVTVNGRAAEQPEPDVPNGTDPASARSSSAGAASEETMPEVEVNGDEQLNGDADNKPEAGEEAPEVEIDADGYRVEERRETETVSHTEEIKEMPERTEVRTREIKEVTLEEVKTKEVTRSATDEEVRALLEAAAFDNEDEVPIGRDIIVEEFTRLESEHEEVTGGKVTMATFSVKEEHTTEEILEKFQFNEAQQTKDDVGTADADDIDAGKTASTEEHQSSDNVQEPAVENEFALAHEKSETSEGNAVAQQGVIEVLEVKEPEVTPADASETLPAAKNEEIEKGSGVPAADETKETAAAAGGSEEKSGKVKRSKSRGIIEYIRVKARSLSRDRGRRRQPARATPDPDSEDPSKAEPSKAEPSKDEPPQSKDADKSTNTKKDKEKKWKLFGKKADEPEEAAGDGSSDPEVNSDQPERAKKKKVPTATLR